MPGFIEDIKRIDALWGMIVRSPVHRGKILEIVYPDIPEDIAIISAKDIPGKKSVSILGGEIPILAGEYIEHIGEPVLLIAGPHLSALKEFGRQIQIICQQEQPLLSEDFDKEFLLEKNYYKGDCNSVFQDAFQISESEYSSHSQERHYSDPSAAYAVPSQKQMEIFCPSQWICHARDSAASALNCSDQDIKIIQTAMSPSFDGKLWYPSILAAQAALLAWKTGKPVFLRMPKEEELVFSPKRHPFKCRYKTAFNQEGILLAIEAEALIDSGAYLVMGEELADRVACSLKGLYVCDNYSIAIKCYKTSFPPFGSFHGLGETQGAFISELHMSRIAELSQNNPADWKRNNLSGIPLKNSPTQTARMLIDHVCLQSDFGRKHSAYEMQNKRRGKLESSPINPRGIGISASFQINGFVSYPEGPASVSMHLDVDNKLTIKSSMSPPNPWVKSQWLSLASSQLGIEEKDIKIESGRSDLEADSGPDIFGRNINIISKLIKRCSAAISKKRFRSPLPITIKRSITTGGEVSKLINFDANAKTDRTWGACVIETEVDLFTLIPAIKGIWLSVCCGDVKDSEQARSRIESAVLQSLQWCSRDPYLPPSPDDYLTHFHLPRVYDLPSLKIYILPDEKSPASGIDDIGDILIPPAFLSAVSQAAGFYFDSIPVTPKKITESLEGI